MFDKLFAVEVMLLVIFFANVSHFELHNKVYGLSEGWKSYGYRSYEVLSPRVYLATPQ